MISNDPNIIDALLAQWHLLCIAGIGGFILFSFSLTEHFNKSDEDKLNWARYSIWFLFLFIGLPALGIIMVSVYVLNGDKLSAMLAFQVGLTSPAIVKALMSATANKMAKTSSNGGAGQ